MRTLGGVCPLAASIKVESGLHARRRRGIQRLWIG